ncbi:ATP-binding cassette domain-containing protein [Streptomyces marianii]|uniref:ATP-binding cassette domain-containing protein n=1 Tax=Streptomyces marianii TaxID=1817406 RepID=UPI002D77D9C6|nr:ATP-binding cassette domain-containing protein [Streptomyces marianii]
MNGFEVDGLIKAFGRTAAADGVSLSAPRGHVLGLLGPNGAGKTTAVRVLATLLRPDAGEVRVAGTGARRDPAQVRRRIALSGQHRQERRGRAGVHLQRLPAAPTGQQPASPTGTLPGWLGAWADINPVTHVMDACRALLNGTPDDGSIGRTLLWSTILFVVFRPLAVRAYGRQE